MSDANDNLDATAPQLTCPKCNSAMEKVPVESFAVDRCTGCKGLFFDALAHEHLLSSKGSAVIDTGALHEEKRDDVVRIKCPACHTQMIRMVDHHQPHIWYESCPICFGIYLDAGEFREQKNRNVLHRIRDIFHHVERP